MKVMIIGADGQVGTNLCQELRSFEIVPLLHSDIEVTDMSSVKTCFELHNPDIVINTATLHAEDCEIYPDKAYQVHALGVRNLAVIAQEYKAKLVHLSTDYVFGGEKEQRKIPYTEFDPVAPINTCGRAKAVGERFIQHLCQKYFIIRTSGVFGIRRSVGKHSNFVEKILKIAREKGEIRVVNDQIFSPTYARDLASKIVELLPTDYYGIFHITNKGSCSWYEFAVEILSIAGVEARKIPITSDEYPMKAKRPHFSVLDHYHLRLLGMDDLRPWKEALQDYMKERKGKTLVRNIDHKIYRAPR